MPRRMLRRARASPGLVVDKNRRAPDLNDQERVPWGSAAGNFPSTYRYAHRGYVANDRCELGAAFSRTASPMSALDVDAT